MKAIATALRGLRRAPAFTGLVVLTLALGIGATTAMFSVVDAVLINPLPFAKADRIVEVWTYFQEGAARAPGATSGVVAAIRNEPGLFEAVSAYQFGSGTITGTGEPEMVSVAGLAPSIFSVFPAAPLIGRLFNDGDATSSEHPILISERMWAGRFGRDLNVIDRMVTIDDVPNRIVGVLPSRFNMPESSVGVWRPIDIESANVRMRVQLVGVLQPGVTKTVIDDRLKALTASLQESGALPKGQYLVTDIPVQVRYGRSGASSLYMLLGAVGVLLLVACVNITNLILVRASSRRGELALMAALGAGRSRLLRDAAIESAMLAVLGGTLGVLLAKGLLQVIIGLAPDSMFMLSSATGDLDLRAVAFAITLTFATCMLFSVLPASRASRVDPIEALKRQSRASDRGDNWWQGALVSTQIALVVVLLAGAGLLLRSFVKLNQVDLGFNPDGLATLYVQLTSPRYSAPGGGLAIMREAERRVETELGLRATIVTSTPIRVGGALANVRPEAEGSTAPVAMLSRFQMATVSPDFFDVFQIPLIEGRTFEPEDGDLAVIISDEVKRRYWGETSPVGRRFRVDARVPWQTVVGVAKDVKTAGPDDRVAEGLEIYQAFDANERYNFLTLAVSAGSRAESVLPQMKRILWDIDSKVPILEAHTLNDQLRDVLARPRFILSLASAFTICAVVIAGVGVYGVSSFWVTRRRRELAIRLAIGASPDRLFMTVIGRSLRLVTIGAVIGLLIAMGGARVIASFLFATDPRDPATFIGVTILLGVIAVAACARPAFKASRVDPMTTLRAE